MDQSPETPTVVVKSKFLEFLLEQLKTHGLPILLLSIAVWYFYNEVKSMQQEIRICNENLIQMYQTNNNKMIEVIGNNTQALDRIIRHDQLSYRNQ